MALNTCNPCTLEAETAGLQIQGQPGLCSLSKESKEKKERRKEGREGRKGERQMPFEAEETKTGG
jgi:hypothetical protein